MYIYFKFEFIIFTYLLGMKLHLLSINIIVLYFFALFSLCINAVAQRFVPPSDSIIIYGKIKNPTIFYLNTLDTFNTVTVKNQFIYNQNGEVKDSIKNMRGIPLKNLLNTIEYIYDKPKQLNEFFFVLTATDDYKVVISWNELYNTEIGNNFYILTEVNGEKLKNMMNRIIFLATADIKTGRRFIKGLKSIEIKALD